MLRVTQNDDLVTQFRRGNVAVGRNSCKRGRLNLGGENVFDVKIPVNCWQKSLLAPETIGAMPAECRGERLRQVWLPVRGSACARGLERNEIERRK